MGKDVYYRNIMLFVQYFQSLVAFKRVAFIKVNIATSFQISPLEWYTSELSNFDRNTLKNNSGVKNWINILLYCFKAAISVGLDLLTDKSYLLKDI